jgi:hypothetical protein
MPSSAAGTNRTTSIPFFRSSVKQGMPAMVHESQEGNLDLQKKSMVNET